MPDKTVATLQETSSKIFCFIADKADNSEALLALNELVQYVCKLEVVNENMSNELGAKHHGF